MVLFRCQTRFGTQQAVDVVYETAGTTHQMVVIVAGAPLEACRVAGWLELSHQVGIFTIYQHIVYGLFGNQTELFAYPLMNLFGRCVRVVN